MDKKDLNIRSSATEFLIFSAQEEADTIEVRYEEANTITCHLKEIFESGELERNSATRKFRVFQFEGSRNVTREIEHYNLEAIISVGYRVNSMKATQFRRWATQVLRKYTLEGYVLSRKRMENGAFLDTDYFEKLLVIGPASWLYSKHQKQLLHALLSHLPGIDSGSLLLTAAVYCDYCKSVF